METKRMIVLKFVCVMDFTMSYWAGRANSLPPQLFLDYDELYLKVRFDNGLVTVIRHLAEDLINE